MQQVDYLAPLEGPLTNSQVENVNLRRHLAEQLAVYDRLRVAEQDRVRAIAQHQSLLDTINSVILESQSFALTTQPTLKSATWPDRPPLLLPKNRDRLPVGPDRDRLSRLPSVGVFNQGHGQEFFRCPIRIPVTIV